MCFHCPCLSWYVSRPQILKTHTEERTSSLRPWAANAERAVSTAVVISLGLTASQAKAAGDYIHSCIQNVLVVRRKEKELKEAPVRSTSSLSPSSPKPSLSTHSMGNTSPTQSASSSTTPHSSRASSPGAAFKSKKPSRKTRKKWSIYTCRWKGTHRVCTLHSSLSLSKNTCGLPLQLTNIKQDHSLSDWVFTLPYPMLSFSPMLSFYDWHTIITTISSRLFQGSVLFQWRCLFEIHLQTSLTSQQNTCPLIFMVDPTSSNCIS